MSYFTFRKVEMSDGGDLYEIVTPYGNRVASATDDDVMSCLEMDLNDLLKEAADRNPDVVINDVGCT